MKKMNKKGFTLIEMVVVVAIIAVLLLILVPTMNGFINTATQEKDLANAKAIYTAALAQDTAHDAGVGNYDEPEDISKLHEDFFQGSGTEGCVINFSKGTNDGKVVSVTCNDQTYPSK